MIETSLLDSLAQNVLSCDISASSGDWSKFNHKEKFDLIVTSETIYNTEYYPALHGVFERRKESFLIFKNRLIIFLIVLFFFSKISLSIKFLEKNSQKSLSKEGTILLAAKDHYFGCGGSVIGFVQFCEKKNEFSVETVWETDDRPLGFLLF